MLETVKNAIYDLKHPRSLNNIPRIEILNGKEVFALLRPIPFILDGEARNDAKLMAKWRNSHKESFFSWITATEQSTALWLKDVYQENDEDIIFMVETPEKIPYGHLSLYNFSKDKSLCEFGRVVRDPENGPRGGITVATRFLLSWIVSNFGIERIFLEVFQDNQKAIALYEKCGFAKTESIALKKAHLSNSIQWVKMPPSIVADNKPDGFALRMEITAEKIQSYKTD